MHRWLRYTVAIAVFVVLFTTSMLVAATQTDALPDDAPVWFQTAPSQPGDRGLYKTALVVVHPDEARYYDMNAQYAFERVADGRFPVAVGELAATQRFVAEWQTGPYEFSFLDALDIPELELSSDCFGQVDIDPASDPQGYSAAMTACGEQMAAEGAAYAQEMQVWAQQMQAMGVDGESWQAALLSDTHTARAADWHVSHHAGNDSVAITLRSLDAVVDGRSFSMGSSLQMSLQARLATIPADVPGPCGWQTSLQQGPQDLFDPITVHGDCPSHMALGFATITTEPGPISMVVSGKDRVDGQDAIVFSMPDDPDRLRLWFVEDRPYPVRILTRADAVPPGLRESMGRDWDEPDFYVMHDLVEYEPGQAAAGVAPMQVPLEMSPEHATGPALGDMAHPWPLATAWQQMQDPAMGCAEAAAWIAQHPEATVTSALEFAGTWSFTAQAQGSTLTGIVGRADRSLAGITQPGLDCSTDTFDEGTPRTAIGPTFGWVARIQEAISGDAATAYGFMAEATLPKAQWTDAEASRLFVDEGGALVMLEQSTDAYPPARFGPEGHDPDARSPWRFHGETGTFHMPSPATAASLAGGAAAASLLFLAWPALKALIGAIPMFSRIRKEDLLSNPVRQQIHDIVSAQPGVHFQEIVRRLEKGRGTTEHHVRKLVSGDILVERPQGGYTCYFPRGAVDRHLMDAAPVLKSAGALAVMRAVMQQPGAASLEIAEALGMSTSTVNYHVKKLMEKGLVEGTRDGRYIRLHGTGLGEQALGQFAT